jgi:hypothetical protein
MKSFGLQYENAFIQSAALAKSAGDNTSRRCQKCPFSVVAPSGESCRVAASMMLPTCEKEQTLGVTLKMASSRVEVNVISSRLGMQGGR